MDRHPVPVSLKVSDLDPADRITMICPGCRREIGEQCYSVALKLPPDYLVIRYVARHLCSRCKVRPDGWIESGPRSGAEGRREGPYPW